MTEQAPPPPRRDVGLWVGIGCLGVLVLSCCLMTFWAQYFGLRFILSQNDGTQIWFSRMILVGALEGTRKTCDAGVVSEDTLPWFPPDMPPESRNVACSLDEETLRALAAEDRSSAVPLSSTDRTELAARFGMDPSHCFEHAAGNLTAVGCFVPEAGSGSIPYQIIDLSRSER